MLGPRPRRRWSSPSAGGELEFAGAGGRATVFPSFIRWARISLGKLKFLFARRLELNGARLLGRAWSLQLGIRACLNFADFTNLSFFARFGASLPKLTFPKLVMNFQFWAWRFCGHLPGLGFAREIWTALLAGAGFGRAKHSRSWNAELKIFEGGALRNEARNSLVVLERASRFEAGSTAESVRELDASFAAELCGFGEKFLLWGRPCRAFGFGVPFPLCVRDRSRLAVRPWPRRKLAAEIF